MHRIDSLMYTLAAGAVTFMAATGFAKVVEYVQG